MKKLILLITMLTLFTACEKQISITEFSEFYENYEPELRVEAFLDASTPMSSLVMVDRSIRIDDTEIFSDIDEEATWQDSIERISRQLADSTALVSIKNLKTGDIIPFLWVCSADSFQYSFWKDKTSILPDSFVTHHYGGFKPAVPFQVDLNSEYELSVISTAYGKTITARTRPVPPVQLLNLDFTQHTGDTLYYTFGEENTLYWLSDTSATSYYITLYGYIPDGRVLINSNSGFSLETDDINYPGYTLGFTFFPPFLTEGRYEFTIRALNADLSRYYVSSLPVNNSKVSNLRDQNGNPVMGIFGSYSSVEKVLIIR
ncbi:MAG: hypothetical protein DRP86_03325 [Candidatus Neomarinimicrobiota bacterium]|nr:MAG: hypothetical protein DRP86_03325 [Candidatus Neomarinimicrobiota bacterium]